LGSADYPEQLIVLQQPLSAAVYVRQQQQLKQLRQEGRQPQQLSEQQLATAAGDQLSVQTPGQPELSTTTNIAPRNESGED